MPDGGRAVAGRVAGERDHSAAGAARAERPGADRDAGGRGLSEAT